MSSSKPKNILAVDTAKQTGAMRDVGGSMDDVFNSYHLGAICNSLYFPATADDQTKDDIRRAAVTAMMAFKPSDEIEALIAGQCVGINASVLECLRRAMVPEQTVEARAMNLNAATKLSRSFAALIDALGRYRGKGMQTVRVEHVTVEAGANAVIGNVHGGRGQKQIERQPHDQAKIAHAGFAALPCQDTARDALPVSGHAERKMQTSRRAKSRRA